METQFLSKNKAMLLLLVLAISSNLVPSLSYDPKNPPKPVREVCHRSGKEFYWYCIAVFNSGSVENGDMKFLSYYTRDFAEGNATDTINKINSTLLPNEPDPYIQQVLNVCIDAFTRLKDELVDRVNPMIVEKDEFEEAKAWVGYGMGLVDSCRGVCMGQPPKVCPLNQDIYKTYSVLKLLSVVLDLLTEGVM